MSFYLSKELFTQEYLVQIAVRDPLDATSKWAIIFEQARIASRFSFCQLLLRDDKQWASDNKDVQAFLYNSERLLAQAKSD